MSHESKAIIAPEEVAAAKAPKLRSGVKAGPMPPRPSVCVIRSGGTQVYCR